MNEKISSDSETMTVRNMSTVVLQNFLSNSIQRKDEEANNLTDKRTDATNRIL